MKAERSLATPPKALKLGAWLLLLAAFAMIGVAQFANEHHHHAAAGYLLTLSGILLVVAASTMMAALTWPFLSRRLSR